MGTADEVYYNLAEVNIDQIARWTLSKIRFY